MRFSKDHIVTAIKANAVVPLFTHEDAEEALAIVAAACQGGMRVLEFTNRKPKSFDVFCQLIKERHRFPDLIIGIGTIMDAITTQKFIDAGADFIVSPIVKPEMGAVCRQNNVHWMPGCGTLTEVALAKENGAEVIKIFPGSVLGPNFVSSVLSVMPDVNLMVTGGVEPNENNLRGWFNAGAIAVGLGSQLFTKEILESKNWDKLTQKVTDALNIAQQVKRR